MSDSPYPYDQDSHKRTPEFWCELLGARIIDPDGWRDGTRDWDEPITKEEFDRRYLKCTVDLRGYAPPGWEMPPGFPKSS